MVSIAGVLRLYKNNRLVSKSERTVSQMMRCRVGGQRVFLRIGFEQMLGSFDFQWREARGAGGCSGGGDDCGLRCWTERKLDQGIVGRRRGHLWRLRVLRVLTLAFLTQFALVLR